MVFSQIPTPCRSYTKADKGFAKNFDFQDVKFPINFRDGKKNSIDVSVIGYEHREKHPVYVSKKYCEDKHADLLLI